MSLREKVSETGGLSERKWNQVTPGMAAGITDHVWTFRELLIFKPDRSPSIKVLTGEYRNIICRINYQEIYHFKNGFSIFLNKNR